MWFEVVSALECTSRNWSWPRMRVRPANCQLSKRSAQRRHRCAGGLSIPVRRIVSVASGGVKIARLPGAVQLSLLMPFRRLDTVGLGDLVRRQYGLA